jgi:hypothetical protein
MYRMLSSLLLSKGNHGAYPVFYCLHETHQVAHLSIITNFIVFLPTNTYVTC